MPQIRPIARDALPVGGAPVLAARYVHRHELCTVRAPVTHSYAALAFYTGGSARVALRGEWELRAGDVMLVPAGEPHRMLEVRRPELWGLATYVPCFAQDAGLRFLDPFEKVRDGASAVVHIPTARHEYLAGLFRELEHVHREPQSSKETLGAVQHSLLTLILAEVNKASRPRELTRAGSSVVVEALRFIERNCLRKLGLSDVAAAVGRSPAYVTTALTRATGRSAVQWIVTARMAEARRLLLHSEEPVDAVAVRVGYADPTHFIRMFRREHGATPASWRATHARVRG